MKKYLLKLLILVSVLLCVTVFANAAEVIDSGYCGGEGDGTNLIWTLTDDGVLTIEGTGAMKNYSCDAMPWLVNRASIQTVQIGDSVTTIGNYAFEGCIHLTAVIIGDSVTTIGDYAFMYCSSLTAVTIGDSVTTIGSCAFINCDSLTAITVLEANNTYSSADGVLFDKEKTELIQYPIGNTRTAYAIPDSVTTIGKCAFYSCSGLTAVTIPDSVTTIGHSAFYSCTKLTAVTIGNSVTTIGDWAFYACSSLTSVTIPDSVTTIGGDAFDSCYNLTAVTIGERVSYIGVYAFYSCTSLTEVTFEGKAPSFGQNVFYGVTATCYYPASDSTWTSNVRKNYGGTLTWKGVIDSGYCGGEGDGTNLTWTLTDDGLLTIEGTGAMKDYSYYSSRPSPWYASRSSIQTVQIGNSVTTIGNYAFNSCSNLTTVTIGNSVTTIGDWAFNFCSSLTSVTIPDSVTTIGDDAFDSCYNLTAVTIGDSVTTIGDCAFVNCSLTAVTIPDSVTTIGYDAFMSCSSLTAVTIGNSVTTIGDGAFYDCSSLTAVTIGNSVTTIGDFAFRSCSSLTAVTIPDSVTTIGDEAFYKCNSLTEVTFEGKAPSFGQNVFCGVTATCYYPANDSTWTSDVMQNYGGTLTWESYIKTIASGYCGGEGDGTNLTWKLTDDGLLTIEGTGAMENFVFFSAPWYAWSDMVETVSIGDGVTTIGDHAFLYCCYLTEVTIPDGVTTIGKYAFHDCDSLTEVTLPDSVTAIGNYVFYDCDGLQKVTISNRLTAISYAAFNGCSSLTEVTIPDSVTVIGVSAFNSCSSLTSVTIGSGVTTIGESAFEFCKSLPGIVIPDHVTAIGRGAFANCSSLFAITVSETNSVYSSKEGVLFSKDQTELIQYPIGNARMSYTIPASVTAIGAYAFHNSSILTEVKIPVGVMTIGVNAFYKCSNLTEVTIPANVTTIGDRALAYCTSLTEVTFCGNAPTFGQNVFYGVTAICYYSADDTTWTSEVMQNYGGELTWTARSFDTFEIAGTTMTLGNDLALNFMLLAADVTGEGWYAEVVHGDRVVTILQSDWIPSGDYVRISYKGMAAKEMVDEIVITVYDANGFAVSEPKTDSARAYAMRMFGWRDSFDTVLADMLNYGAAAQLQFNYKTDDLANSLMTAEQQAKATKTVTMTDIRQSGSLYQGASLELENNIVLNFYYSRSLVGKTATVSYTDHYGQAHSYAVPVLADGSLAKVSVDKLVISDCSVPVTVTIGDISVTDSVESYCARMQGYLELGEPLMKFASSARAYFG